jgi:hypothetical protein
MGMVAVWYVVLALPLRDQKRTIAADIAAAQAQLDDIDRTMKDLPEFVRRSEDLERFRRDLNSSLFTKTHILDLIDQLQRHAHSQHLRVTEVSPPVEELILLNRQMLAAETVPFLNLTVSLQGDYVAFGRYVGWLEAQPFFRGVNHCRIAGTRESVETPVYIIGFRALLGVTDQTS